MKKNYFALILILLVSMSCAQEQRQTEQEKRIFIQLFSVNSVIQSDFSGTIAALAEMGYTGVELFGYDNGTWFGKSPAEIRHIVEDAGMTIVSSHIRRALARNPEETNWDELWNFWDTAIQAHKEAGIKHMVIPSIGNDRLQSLEHVMAYAEYFNKLGARANAAGLRFGFHNHDWVLTNKIDGVSVLDIWLKNTDPEKVFFQLDLYWVVRAGKDPVDYFNRFPGRFLSLHVKDTGVLGAPGIMNFCCIFNHLENSGAMYMIVEIEGVEDQMVAARESIEYLRGVSWWRNTYLD